MPTESMRRASPSAASPLLRAAPSAKAEALQAEPAADLDAANRAHPPSRSSSLAAAVAAIAAEPSRWTRASAGGGARTLEPGWREWLARLDTAVGERWQRASPSPFATDARSAETTLTLLADGRPALVIVVDGTTARIDDVAAGEHWRATLPFATAAQLRATAERLPR
jgi:hypothetical protein